MTTIWQRAEALLKNDLTAIEAFFTGDVWPALKNWLVNTVEEEVAAILPILETALPTVLNDAGALFSPSGWAVVANNLASTVLPQIEAAGLKVASDSLHTAIGAVLSTAKAKAAGTAAAGS